MTKNEFMTRLMNELHRRNVADAAEVAEEYEQHFAFKLADGYSEEEIAAKLGAPVVYPFLKGVVMLHRRLLRRSHDPADIEKAAAQLGGIFRSDGRLLLLHGNDRSRRHDLRGISAG